MASAITTHAIAPPLPNTLPQSRDRRQTTVIYNSLFGQGNTLPESVMQIIHDYSAMWPYRGTNYPFPDVINLSASKVLVTYLGTDFRHPSILSAAIKIAKRVYECSNRTISVEGGEAYCMAPEVLAYAMQLAKGQTVLEIAGASGEHSILLACSDATHVYFNEINSEENKRFQNLQKDLPPAVKKKLTALEGDCFTLPTMRPELLNKIDLIFCQNLIHFFNASQEKDFFDLIKKMLKPSGRAIFTANAIAALMKGQKPPREYSYFTTFRVFQCYSADHTKKPVSLECIFGDHIPVDDNVPMDYQVFHLYNRESNAKWVVDNEAFNRIIEPSMRQKIKEAIQEKKKNFNSIKAGKISVITSEMRFFTTQTLQTRLIKHGFDVESTFNISLSGHLQESPENALKVGAIVRLPCGILRL